MNDVLNPAQLEAVMTLKGPLLVIAGAGSGKTRTLVYRVARLVEIGVRAGTDSASDLHQKGSRGDAGEGGRAGRRAVQSSSREGPFIPWLTECSGKGRI